MQAHVAIQASTRVSIAAHQHKHASLGIHNKMHNFNNTRHNKQRTSTFAGRRHVVPAGVSVMNL